MTALVFLLATAAALWALVFVYQAAIAGVARRVGVVVEEVSIGVGPTLWVRHHNTEVWRFRPLPLGGWTRLRGMGDAPDGSGDTAPRPGSFQAAPLAGQLFAMAAGPLSSLLAGVGLLGVAVALGHPQLTAGPAERPERPPTFVPDSAQTTWRGQFQFTADTAGVYFARLLTFRALDGWGGPVAFLTTAGRVGAVSATDWVTMVGVAGVALGCVNMLPLPSLVGFAMLQAVAAAALGRPQLPDKITTPISIVGALLAAVVFVRVVWLDVCWVWSGVAG